MSTRPCKTCGKEIPFSPHGKSFCDSTCKRNAPSKTAIKGFCKNCNKEMKIWHCRPRIYCSKPCMVAVSRKRYPNEPPKCKHCAKEIPRIYWSRSNCTYCSRACRSLANPTQMKEITCKHCGIVFEIRKNYPTKRFFCSRQCKKLAFRSPRICPTCTKCFQPMVGQVNNIYCSRICMGESYKNRRTVVCVVCEKTFELGVGTRLTAKTCSKQCATVFQRRNKIAHICKFCNKTFYLGRSTTKDRSKKYGVNYCSRRCCKKDPNHRHNMINAFDGRPTKLETVGYAMLDSENISYIPQHALCDWIRVDAFVPSSNLVIEFDGDYWHCNPAIYKNLSPNQEKWAKKDQARKTYLTKCGYNILRIWESDMYKRPDEVRQRLRAALL